MFNLPNFPTQETMYPRNEETHLFPIKYSKISIIRTQEKDVNFFILSLSFTFTNLFK
jgi:hypothetical protein